jgi:hypothetical protein
MNRAIVQNHYGRRIDGNDPVVYHFLKMSGDAARKSSTLYHDKVKVLSCLARKNPNWTILRHYSHPILQGVLGVALMVTPVVYPLASCEQLRANQSLILFGNEISRTIMIIRFGNPVFRFRIMNQIRFTPEYPKAPDHGHP